MNQKTIAFKKPALSDRATESWIDGHPGPVAVNSAPTTRLTLDLPAALHRRLKVRCAENGVRMVEVVRELLEREFPA